jgi:broad-specificity NMP kinase
MLNPSDTEPALAAVESVPIVVEVIGPAGAGKTTLVAALRQRHGNTAPDIEASLTKIGRIPSVVGNSLVFLPEYVRRHRHSRWFTRREIRGMAYLTAGLRLLDRQGPRRGTVTMLDHGPLYRLAFLREFGAEITTSPSYQKWWSNLLRHWSERIDIVVWLDAPDSVLLARIRARGSWHAVKDMDDVEASDLLRRYRAACERTIAEAAREHPMSVHRFDTSQRATEQIVDDVLVAFANVGAVARAVGEDDLSRAKQHT